MSTFFCLDRLALAATAVATLGCGTPVVEAARPQVCSVAVPGDVSAMVANEHGVVFAMTSGAGLVLQRASGDGCDLSDDDARIAAESLLDVDDRGNLYVFPAEANEPGITSTMLAGEYPGSMVAKVDATGTVTKLMPANRGIWSFGVSPSGDTLWVSACGPSGIFSTSNLTASMTPPETLWEQLPSVLTDEQTFWSVGPRTCDPTSPLTDRCGFALVRTTPERSDELASTVIDFGAGFEQASLARCGANVCGVFASAVVVWDREGTTLATISREDLGASPTERIAMASGNRHGVYVLLQTETAGRVVFIRLV